jgi:hypothetical protein
MRLASPRQSRSCRRRLRRRTAGCSCGAAQDLDGALDFVCATDQRVDFAVARELVEVDGELGQRHRPCLALAASAAASPPHELLRLFAAVLGDAWECN